MTATLLVILLMIGGAFGLALIGASAALQAARNFADRRRQRLDRWARTLILTVVSAEAIPLEAVRARGGEGRAVERVTRWCLAQVRGEAHARCVEIMRRRGAAGRAWRAAGARGATRRAGAAETLGLLATPDAVRRLEQMARGDRRRRVRIVAVRALGDSRSPAAAATLAGLLDTTGRLSVPAGVTASALLAAGAAALPALRQAAAGPGGTPRRATAVDLLGMLKDLPAGPTIAACLRHEDPRLRRSAARALGQLGRRGSVRALAERLSEDSDPAVRAAAAWALGRIRDPRAIAPLRRSVSDPDYDVAHGAAGALTMLGAGGTGALARVAETGGATAAAHAREALLRGVAPAATGLPPGLSPVLSPPPDGPVARLPERGRR